MILLALPELSGRYVRTPLSQHSLLTCVLEISYSDSHRELPKDRYDIATLDKAAGVVGLVHGEHGCVVMENRASSNPTAGTVTNRVASGVSEHGDNSALLIRA